MSYRLYSDEEKRLQRKLIPLNLIVALLALVAAISLIITPLLKIDIGKLAPALMDAVSPIKNNSPCAVRRGGLFKTADKVLYLICTEVYYGQIETNA